MLEFLNNLKRKPKHVRSRIAFFSTIGIFFVIVNIWWISFKSPVNDSSVPVTEVITPLGVVVNMVMGMKDDAQYMATSLKDQLQYHSTTTPSAQTANVSASGENEVTYPSRVFKDDQSTISKDQSN